jgi:hypothetical protein
MSSNNSFISEDDHFFALDILYPQTANTASIAVINNLVKLFFTKNNLSFAFYINKNSVKTFDQYLPLIDFLPNNTKLLLCRCSYLKNNQLQVYKVFGIEKSKPIRVFASKVQADMFYTNPSKFLIEQPRNESMF